MRAYPTAEMLAIGPRRQGITIVVAENQLIRSPWMTILMMVLGGVLGGYLGAIIGWLVWSTAGRTALSDRISVTKRVAVAILGCANAVILYYLGFTAFAQMVGSL